MQEAFAKADECMSRKRGFETAVAKGLGTAKAYQLAADYTDQYMQTQHLTLNTYYRCGHGVGQDYTGKPLICNRIIRTDRWTMHKSIEQELDDGGGQRWY